MARRKNKLTRWERAAARDLERRRKAAGPLFAPLEAPAKPAEIQARAERHAAQVDIYTDPVRDARLRAQGDVDRATVAAAVSAEELARLDKIGGWGPQTGLYHCDFWQCECRRRGLRWIGQERHEAFWAPINAAITAHRARRDAIAKAGEQLDLPSGLRFEAPTEAEQVVFVGPLTDEDAIAAAEEAAEIEATIAALRARPGPG